MPTRVLTATTAALVAVALSGSPAAAAPKADKEQAKADKSLVKAMSKKGSTITIVSTTSGNTAGEDAGDQDNVYYVCVVSKNKASVTCGDVSN